MEEKIIDIIEELTEYEELREKRDIEAYSCERCCGCR